MILPTLKIDRGIRIATLMLLGLSTASSYAKAAPRWARGPSDSPLGFALGNNYQKTIVLLDARDLYDGKDSKQECQDGNIKLGIADSRKFCAYPDIQKIWVSPNKISILKNNLGIAAVDVKVAQVEGRYGLLVTLKVKLGIADSTYKYIREAFPNASYERLTAKSVIFDLVKQALPESVKVDVDAAALLAEGDQSYVQIEMSQAGLDQLRCSFRLRDALYKNNLTLYEGLGDDLPGSDFFTMIAGEYKPSYRVLSSESLFTDAAKYNDFQYGNLPLDVIVSENLKTDADEAGFYLPGMDADLSELPTSSQAAAVIERTAKAAFDVLSGKSLECPLVAAQAQTEYAKRALEVLASNPAALHDYQISVTQ
jgi:hypothetical protein